MPYLHDKLPYDPRDLAPIARISNTIVAVVVPSSSDIKTVKELVETARANPGKLNWATITGMFDFVFAGFQKKMGIEIAKVPYRDTVQAVNDLAEGRIQVMMSAIAIVRPRVQAGAIRMIAVTASERASIASRCSDHHRGRLSRHPDRRPDRPVRAARDAGGVARARSPPT